MRKQLMAHKIIAVYGNSGSYKTTTALSLARYMAAKGTNIILVGALPNRFFPLQLLLRASSPVLWARLFPLSISIVI